MRDVPLKFFENPRLTGLSVGPARLGRHDEKQGCDHVKQECRRHAEPSGGKAENMVMVQPKLADDDEADKPAQKLGKQLKQRGAKFARTPVIA